MFNANSIYGHWSPRQNKGWPRLNFSPSGRGFFEDGDFPILYSVVRFEYEVHFGNVLVILKSDDEELRDDRKGTRLKVNTELTGEFEFALEAFPQTNDRMLSFSYAPYPFIYREFKLVSEGISPDYAPAWKFI